MPHLDLSHPIRPGMPAYPGTGPPEFEPIADYDPDGYRERRITMVSHTGTHLDAPAHMIPGGKTLDRFPLSHFSGPGCVLDVTDLSAGGTIGEGRLDMIENELNRSAFLLVRTGWAAKWGTPAYFEGIPVFAEPAAERLAGLAESNGGALRGVGLDVISVDPVGAETFPVHRILLGAGLLIAENLADFSPLPASGFEFRCPPLPLADADGAPCRAGAVW